MVKKSVFSVKKKKVSLSKGLVLFHNHNTSILYRITTFSLQSTSRYCQEPAHEIPPMTRSWGESLTGRSVFRDSEKLPPALTLKMISVFLMLASINYSLISVTQAEGLPDLFPNKDQFRTLINKFPGWWYFMRLSRVKGVF